MVKHAKWIFGSAALFNFLVGATLMAVGPSLLGGEASPLTGEMRVILNLAGGLILVFAVSYACVAMNPMKFAPFIWQGALGKTLAICVAVWPWVMGTLPGPFPFLVLIDLLYVVLFVMIWRELEAS